MSTSSLPVTKKPALDLPAAEGSSRAVPVRLVKVEGSQFVASPGTVTAMVGAVLSMINVREEAGTA